MQLDAIQDEVFGKLAYDPPLTEWYASVALGTDRTIDVTICWEERQDGPFTPVLERARKTFLLFRQQEPEHRNALAKAMLKRYRDSARVELDLPHADELARELIATQVSIAADGTAIIHYDDNAELFGDHSIMADLDRDGSFLGFTLHG